MLTLSRFSYQREEKVSEEPKEIVRQLAVYGNAGMNFVCAVLVGFAVGWALDNKVFSGNTAPWLTFFGLALGIAAGFRSLWKLAERLRDE